MRKMTALDRILLLGTALLAAYQVVTGVEGMDALALTSYTVGFGVLLVAALLLIILGFEVLDAAVVVIVSTIIPLSLSLGLVAQWLPGMIPAYFMFVIVGFIAIIVTRFRTPGRVAVLVLAAVHGVSGLLIFGLPLVFALGGQARPGFALVGFGGAMIGLGGLLLSFLKAGHPILSRQTILSVFPALFMATTTAFVAGFILG